jgi:hypothetical protein
MYFSNILLNLFIQHKLYQYEANINTINLYITQYLHMAIAHHGSDPMSLHIYSFIYNTQHYLNIIIALSIMTEVDCC